jgi:hypothetical protein
MYQIIDDLLDESLALEIEQLVKHRLHYSYIPKTTGVDRTGYTEVTLTPDTKDTGQMCCSVYHINNKQPTPFHGAIGLLDQILEVEEVLRCKVNLLFVDSGREDQQHHTAHVDSEEDKTLTVVYYCNDTDGDTFMFNEVYKTDKLTQLERVAPKRNRALVFDARRYHASSSPKNGDNRFVVNFVFKIK